MSDQDDLLELDLVVGADDWRPTPHGRLLGRALLMHDVVRDADVLELGGGVGNHTVLLLRRGARTVVTTEITEARSATTRANVERNSDRSDVVEYRVADWVQTSGSFDVLITNPPFAKSGKRNRRYFIDALILESHKLLRPDGRLIFIQSSMANLAKTRRRLEENGFEVTVLAATCGPFRDYYFEDPTFMAEIETFPDAYETIGATPHERLYVVSARLVPWSPPKGAHLP